MAWYDEELHGGGKRYTSIYTFAVMLSGSRLGRWIFAIDVRGQCHVEADGISLGYETT